MFRQTLLLYKQHLLKSKNKERAHYVLNTYERKNKKDWNFVILGKVTFYDVILPHSGIKYWIHLLYSSVHHGSIVGMYGSANSAADPCHYGWIQSRLFILDGSWSRLFILDGSRSRLFILMDQESGSWAPTKKKIRVIFKLIKNSFYLSGVGQNFVDLTKIYF